MDTVKYCPSIFLEKYWDNVSLQRVALVGMSCHHYASLSKINNGNDYLKSLNKTTYPIFPMGPLSFTLYILRKLHH